MNFRADLLRLLLFKLAVDFHGAEFKFVGIANLSHSVGRHFRSYTNLPSVHADWQLRRPLSLSVRLNQPFVRLNVPSVRLNQFIVRLNQQSVRMNQQSVRMNQLCVRLFLSCVRLNKQFVRLNRLYVRLNQLCVRLNEPAVRLFQSSERITNCFKQAIFTGIRAFIRFFTGELSLNLHY
jgi:hypothetical protein